MRIRVDSEVAKLRRVLVHRPGVEIDRMPPSMMETLLFDDIVDGDQARDEHTVFRKLLARAGAEVLEAERLLAESLAGEGVRSELFRELVDEHGCHRRVVERLEGLTAEGLARTLIEGLPAAGPHPGGEPFFDLPPIPNYFFQRDPQFVLGSRVVISSMATDAREREPLAATTFFRHHPVLSKAYDDLFEIDILPAGDRPNWSYASLEGGDVLVPSPEVVLIGLSERTNRRGVEALAEYLRREETSFRHLILVELPLRRSYMHLDTVFTFIDREQCLAYLPVVEPAGPESAYVYSVDLSARDLSFKVRPSLRRALAECGLEVELVPCGGPDRVDQEREQWTDGANAFAVAPGVILLYRRNRRTLEELDRRGWRVLGEAEVVEGREEMVGHGPTVVALVGQELSRARGGPRCMTMPLEREAL
jgi:arginine deiminase